MPPAAGHVVSAGTKRAVLATSSTQHLSMWSTKMEKLLLPHLHFCSQYGWLKVAKEKRSLRVMSK